MEPRTALVIDDSRSARFALRRILEARGFAVDTAESAADALQYLGNRRPALVFLDYTMPGIDGFALLDRLAADPRTAGIPVVICSSNDSDAFVDEARAHGATAVLSKPPDGDRLARVLASLEAAQAAAAPPAGPATAPPAPAAGDDAAGAFEQRLAALEARLAAVPDLETVRGIVHEACAEAVAALRVQMQALERRVDALDAPATELEARVLRQAREAAERAALAAAEQAVTSASARIAERIADALVRAAGDDPGADRG